MADSFDPQKTQPLQGGGDPSSGGISHDPGRTQVMGPTPPFSPMPGAGGVPNFDPKKTQVMPSGPTPAGFDPTKTQVYQGPGVSPAQRPAPQNRKLIGWLVSFTIHPNGVDFRLYEGKNTIGTNPACDIVLQDPQVSGHHLTLLIRPGTNAVRFKDEFSTNGTLINGTPLDEGTLQDGDIIKIGSTELKFRSV
jgi:hypothetical protein